MPKYRGLCLAASCLSLTSVWISEARLGAPSPYVVQLRKEHARNISAEEAKHHHGGGYFVGDILIGGPESQKLTVTFPTTAGMISLPGSACISEACRLHHSYSPQLSETSVDVQQDGRTVDPNGGQRAPLGQKRDSTSIGFAASDGNATDLEGYFVTDNVCMGDMLGNTNKVAPLCPLVYMVVATKESDMILSDRPNDGMIGLARKELSLTSDFNILERITSFGMQSQFGFFVEDDAKKAEITFGGYDKNRVEHALKWSPVALPSSGHWLVDIKAVKVGGKTLKVCSKGSKPCMGLFSTGSPSIFAAESDAPEVLEAINADKTPTNCALPELTFVLAGGVELSLEAVDYAGPRCVPEVGPHHMKIEMGGANIWMLGEPLFRRYYAVFDWGKMQMGFGRSTVERNCQRLEAAGFPTDQFKCFWPRQGDEL